MSRKEGPLVDKAGPILEKIEGGMALAKCRACGCLHRAMESFARVLAGTPGDEAGEILDKLNAERARLEAEAYNCLGCDSCWGAEASVLCAELFGDAAMETAEEPCSAPLAPEVAPGCGCTSCWPPVPGDYLAGNRDGAVAICTLANAELPGRLASRDDPALALVGRCRTENIGIEKLVRNVIATPSIHWLILCGEEARGHRPGEALLRLGQKGVDAAMRIQGASSWRPVLKNLTLKEVSRFRRQVKILDCIGTTDPVAIGEEMRACATRPVEPLEAYRGESAPPDIPRIAARAPSRLQLDPAGFFIILVDRSRHLLVCEHYDNDGRLDRIIEGRQAALVAATAVEQKLVSRLDHAAYLGRELSRAEAALETGAPYRQDAALGEPDGRQKCPAADHETS